jgi:hypothetical protein
MSIRVSLALGRIWREALIWPMREDRRFGPILPGVSSGLSAASFEASGGAGRVRAYD